MRYNTLGPCYAPLLRLNVFIIFLRSRGNGSGQGNYQFTPLVNIPSRIFIIIRSALVRLSIIVTLLVSKRFYYA